MSAAPECVRAFFEEVFRWFPYTPEAEEWLKRSVTFEVEDLNSTRGGGWWQPAEDKVFLYTAQYEAAIHELAHAWWHYRRLGVEDEFMAVVQRLAADPDPRWQGMQRLAHGYIHGIPEQNWPGMLVDRNDWEMYAGLASGCMADIRLLPPYVAAYYEGLFRRLPDAAPEPVELAPHR
ncbi:MAG TPA: hypothetical protein VK009_03340 [Chloroflexota bacterium]|nr:hypothetical protein [Chloroflexota bacterium]